jgi:lysophospholipase L1-like esterase
MQGIRDPFATQQRQMTKHLILIGDSVFDNGAYVLPGQADVSAHLKAKIVPKGWSVDVRAVDGDVVSDIQRQLRSKPIPKPSTFILSVGGNDALGHVELLWEPIPDGSMASALMRFREIRESFRRQYVRALDSILSHEQPLIACTIYNPKFPDADLQTLAETALSFFNDVIAEETLRRSVPIIDLRDVCSEAAAFANPIEPSETGGDLITNAIVSHLSD